MAHGDEGVPDWDSTLGIVKQTSAFSFGSRGNDMAESATLGVNRSVGTWVWFGRRWGRHVTEEAVTGNAAPCFRQYKIRCVGVDVEDHAAGMAADDGVGIGSGVVEKLSALGNGQGGRTSLLRGDFIKGREHGGVDCTCVVEEGAVDGLHACCTDFVEGG